MAAGATESELRSTPQLEPLEQAARVSDSPVDRSDGTADFGTATEGNHATRRSPTAPPPTTGADVKNLTSADVTNGKMLAEDFAPGQLPKGETGATGPAGSALAYAHINADGTVDQANSKNVTVPLSAPGQYCLDVTTGERPHNVVASIDAAVGNSGVYDGIAPTLVPDFVAAACAPSTTADAYVDTRDRTSAFPTRAAKPFYVVFN
jgi:hypothetical protein